MWGLRRVLLISRPVCTYMCARFSVGQNSTQSVRYDVYLSAHDYEPDYSEKGAGRYDYQRTPPIHARSVSQRLEEDQ